jgi:hypothetical protein
MEHILNSLKDSAELIEKEKYTISSLSKEVLDGDRRGWLLGHFYPENSILHRDDVEVAMKVLEENFTEEPHYHICPFEFVLILSGSVEYEISGNMHTSGMFYLMKPYTVARVTKVREKAVVLCVRLPSIPNSKIIEANKQKHT